VNFKLVGHTHDDIDALFGRWNMSLRKENYLTIPLLMKTFMDVESIPTIPHFIEEVPNFKGFIAGCITEGDEALRGHSRAQQFNFFVNFSGCFMMKYRIQCRDSDQLPKEGGGMKLWREDKEGRPIWPCGEPATVSVQLMKNLDEILKGISRFIRYWEKLSNEDSIGEYHRCYEHFATTGML
jgi:hypothetical protein